MRHYYFLVEGAHDVAVIARLVKSLGFREIKNTKQLPDLWNALIPDRFPFEEDKLDRVTPVPSFYSSDEVSIAIKVANGYTKLAPILDLTLLGISIEDLMQISGIAVLFDADTKTAAERLTEIQMEFKNKCENFILDNGNIICKDIKIKADFYVFPNNHSNGTLETMLIQTAEKIYPDLLAPAVSYVDGVSQNYKDDWSISDRDKVFVGCIANVLKPGKANQVSINDNQWISERTISDCQSVVEFFNFIKTFIMD